MKFGLQLLTEKFSEWGDNYISYNKLKTMLSSVKADVEKAAPHTSRSRTASIASPRERGSLVEESGRSSPGNRVPPSPILKSVANISTEFFDILPSRKLFIAELEKQFDKVNAFFNLKLSEIAVSYEELKREAVLFRETGETRKSRDKDGLSTAMFDLYVHLTILQRYSSLNYTGFVNIVKKHDKITLHMNMLDEEWQARLKSADFNQTGKVRDFLEGVESEYAHTFERGNRHKALALLRDVLLKDVRLQANKVSCDLLSKKAFIIDMDGVLYHQNHLLPGVPEFIEWLQTERKKYLFLTNSSDRSPKELREKLLRYGISASEEHFYTSALATADFLSRQTPRGSAYVIGEGGLLSALYDVGYSVNDVDPDYVIVGETRNFNYERLQTAVNLVRKGARLIGTNPDIYDKSLSGICPGCQCLVTPIALATGVKPYYLGKPNPIMFQSALKRLEADPSTAVMIGDRMDTDIVGGIEAGLETVLVLSGVSQMEDLKSYAFRPDHIMGGVADILSMTRLDN
eukprot:Colp12_sorted_trinity150504_noHs@33265